MNSSTDYRARFTAENLAFLVEHRSVLTSVHLNLVIAVSQTLARGKQVSQRKFNDLHAAVSEIRGKYGMPTGRAQGETVQPEAIAEMWKQTGREVPPSGNYEKRRFERVTLFESWFTKAQTAVGVKPTKAVAEYAEVDGRRAFPYPTTPASEELLRRAVAMWLSSFMGRYTQDEVSDVVAKLMKDEPVGEPIPSSHVARVARSYSIDTFKRWDDRKRVERERFGQVCERFGCDEPIHGGKAPKRDPEADYESRPIVEDFEANDHEEALGLDKAVEDPSEKQEDDDEVSDEL